ncbi:seryl-tRNA(Sec) kinase [Chloropicon primus]|uniref:Seryl-tRNA(Sec) kinase n=1 Tax=Chloropicon primus TaxID=1764295 RepID=A0A5B8MCC0_9CHLO|nr:seryl-tRNA(Sec) kinase [Chloropicon primus]UPQ97214.1 seryl-tRNA(Sec) kinase [Chloropicon primus]|eukprot:QDZ17999.1 seryl-tRNA(Sec) kinase [Chloropicon primus]
MAAAEEEWQGKARVLILVLCGLAGGGKSTLAGQIVERVRESTPRVVPEWICFDDFCEEGGQYDPETWREGRREALAKVAREAAAAATPTTEGRHKLVVVDDNMHLRSMRREIYLVARKHGAALAVLHVNTELPEALERNAKRPRPLPDHVLVRMHASFEPPGGGWEAERTLVARPRGGGVEVEELWRRIQSKWTEAVSDFHSPELEAARKAEGQLVNGRSQIHQLDNRMRKEISSAARSWKADGGLSGEEVSKRVLDANAARKDVLADLRPRIGGETGEETVQSLVREAENVFGAKLLSLG